MERVTGIGGAFFRARDPAAIGRWYSANLGISAETGEGGEAWWQDEGPTVWAPFPETTDYFGRPDQAWMINFRVRDLDAMLLQLRDAGVDVDEGIEVMPGIGRFGWASDPEGNRFELWEPASETLVRPGS